MILVGLTGGIGSGKSTVSSLLAERGAVVIDADLITREVQAPGSPVLDALAERFGPQVLHVDGSLNRQAVADIVFTDANALADLNAIVHPAVGKEMVSRVNELTGTDRVVVLDIPLLVERPRQGLQATIVVDVPVDVQVERLVRYRGFSEDDARARIANQASRETRRAAATKVIDNSAGVDALAPQVDELWTWLNTLEQLPADFVYEP